MDAEIEIEIAIAAEAEAPAPAPALVANANANANANQLLIGFEQHGYHHLLIRDIDYKEIKNAGQRIGKNHTIRKLYAHVLDPNTEKHCECMVTLFRGLRKRSSLLHDVIIAGVDFGTSSSSFHRLAVQLKKWMFTSSRLRKITIADCNFRSISQFVGIGQSIASSLSIREIIFKDIDFVVIGGSRAVMMSYLNAAFARNLFSRETKNIHFRNCTMQNQHVIELIRGISGPNHPRSFTLEGGDTLMNTHECELLNEELSNHSSANGSLGYTAYATAHVPPITLLSLKGIQIGNDGVSTLLTLTGRKEFGFVRLNLSQCEITDDGCESVAVMIEEKRAPYLRSLIMEENYINDRGSISIASALSLSANSRIRCVLLGKSHGCITEKGFHAFYQLVFNDQTPDYVKNSNFSISRVTLDCRRQHGVTIPGETRDRLERVLCINASSRLTRESTRVTAKREKLIEMVYNKYLKFGEGNFMNELFPGLSNLITDGHKNTESALKLKYIYLLLGWVASSHQHKHSELIRNNLLLENSKYWLNRANSTRELTLFYSAIRIRLGTSLRNETRYNFRSTTRWAIQQKLGEVYVHPSPLSLKKMRCF